jgi:hypothetical protein
VRSVAGDFFIVPFEAMLHRLHVVVEAVPVRYGFGDRGL